MGLFISICDECIKPNIEHIEDREVSVRTYLPEGNTFLTKRKTSRLGNIVEIPYDSFDKNKKSAEKRRPSYLH